MHELLQAAGYEVRRNRATCTCSGRARFTIAVAREVAYCHRCKATWNAWSLARGLNQPIPARRVGKARIRKEQFHLWLKTKSGELANRESLLSRQAILAESVLAVFPQCESAWSALARFYHGRRNFEIFFGLASHKIGRLQLYRRWRRRRNQRG